MVHCRPRPSVFHLPACAKPRSIVLYGPATPGTQDTTDSWGSELMSGDWSLGSVFRFGVEGVGCRGCG